MKKIALFVSAIVLLAAASAASATSITGEIGIGGNDTFNNTGVAFSSPNPVVLATGSMGIFAPTVVSGIVQSYSATMSNFNFATAAGTTLFTVSNGVTTLTMDIVSLVNSSTPGFLNITGTGLLSETGFDNTTGSFTLSSSASGQATFEFNSIASVTPEPSSLVLLGTGLVGAAGMLVRRRRAMAATAV